ncbi:putative glucose-6-phosphate 1-epimerase [Abditibacteriota bacterium]|nr:putative glucose-6-phosphate 1-epimerase [Abditibacteriota bacterium]
MLQKLVFPDAELYLQGAHLTRFKDWLYLSSRSHFAEGKAIRGGIPVVFPWFGPKRDDASAPQHGWARTSLWNIEGQSQSSALLAVRNDEWYVRLHYGFGDTLTVTVEVQNLATKARSFELALHSYFTVSDVTKVQIEGLDSLTYRDKTRGNERFTQSGTLHFEGEVDRIYLNAPSPLHIVDGMQGYELRGDWASAVTWNPGATKAAQMSDLGEGEWQNFVCLEVGAIADNAIELAPQATWTMNVEVSRI